MKPLKSLLSAAALTVMLCLASQATMAAPITSPAMQTSVTINAAKCDPPLAYGPHALVIAPDCNKCCYVMGPQSECCYGVRGMTVTFVRHGPSDDGLENTVVTV